MQNLFCVLFLLLTLISSSAQAQWVQTAGPKQDPDFLAVTGVNNKNGGLNILAGATNGFIYYSTNSGLNWDSSFNVQSPVFTFFAHEGNAIFVGTSSGGIYKSTDGGISWNSVNNGLSDLGFSSVSSLLLSGTDTLLFAGSFQSHLFFSNDNGSSWQTYGSAFGGSQVSGVVSVDTDLFAGTYTSGIFRSSDKGVSWTAADSGLANQNVNDMVVIGSDIFAGTSEGVYESSDLGKYWTPINNGLTNVNVWSLFESGKNLFVGTKDGGIFKSTDLGLNWQNIGTSEISSTINDIYV